MKRYTVLPFLAALLLALPARGQEPSIRARVALALAAAQQAPAKAACECSVTGVCTCAPGACDCPDCPASRTSAATSEPAPDYQLPQSWGNDWRWDPARRTWWRWVNPADANLVPAAYAPRFRPAAFAPMMAMGGGGNCRGGS